jgi:predicted nuclease with TOPRIM domain
MSDADLNTLKALLDGQNHTIAAQWAGLRYELQARFDAVDDRLYAIDEKQRIANGRVTKMEGSLERVDERISQLQREENAQESRLNDLERRHDRRRAADRVPARTVTRRDALMFSTGGAAVIGVIKFAVWAYHEIKGLL